MIRKLIMAVMLILAIPSPANALGPDDNAQLFSAYQERLRYRRESTRYARQARALAHQAASRRRFNPPTHASLLRFAMNPSGINYNGPPIRRAVRPRVVINVFVESEN